MNWDRVRGDRIVRDHGAETIEGRDRTITPLGKPAQRPLPVPAKRGSPVAKMASGNIKGSPTIRRALMRMRRKQAADAASGGVDAPKPVSRRPAGNVKQETVEEARAAIVAAELEKERRKAEREADRAQRRAKHFENELRLRPGKARRRKGNRSDTEGSKAAAPSSSQASRDRGTIVQSIGKRSRSVTLEVSGSGRAVAPHGRQSD
jgi:hypothetical protein